MKNMMTGTALQKKGLSLRAVTALPELRRRGARRNLRPERAEVAVVVVDGDEVGAVDVGAERRDDRLPLGLVAEITLRLVEEQADALLDVVFKGILKQPS